MNDALTTVRRLLGEGQISLEDLVDLMLEQLDLIERGEAFDHRLRQPRSKGGAQ